MDTIVVTVGVGNADSQMIDKIPTAEDDLKDNIKSIAAICSLLGIERRVAVIDALELGEMTCITELIEECVTDRESEEQVRISMYHNHLPQLATAGVIEYDWETGEVWCGPQYRLVREALQAVRQTRS